MILSRKSNNILIDNKKNAAKLFNKYLINAVQNIVGEAPSCIGDPANPEFDSCTVKGIIFEYDSHSSIKDINANY